MYDKKRLTEAEIIQFIMPAVTAAGWDTMIRIRQEVKLRDRKVIVPVQIGIRKKVKSTLHQRIPKGREFGCSELLIFKITA